jgi:hypothetical protein
MSARTAGALKLQQPLPDDALEVVRRGGRRDGEEAERRDVGEQRLLWVEPTATSCLTILRQSQVKR